MTLGFTIGVGDGCPQATLFGDIIGIIQLTGIIRDCVGPCPSGQDISLGTREIQDDILIGVGAGAQRIAGNPQGFRRTSHTIGGRERRIGAHGPATRSFHIAIGYQVVAGGCVPFFHLQIICVEGSDCAAVIYENAILICGIRGKGDADPNPAIVYGRRGNVVYQLTCPALAAIGDHQRDGAAL